MDAAINTTRPGLVGQVTMFGRHFLEMCIAMCLGVAGTTLVLNSVLSDVRAQSPGPSLVAISVAISLPMIAWMRFRGMPWRPILEMTLIGVAVVVVVASLGVIPAATVAVGTVCGLECAGMLVAMLFRLDLYTGRTEHHHPGR
jgi:hypothetical protein